MSETVDVEQATPLRQRIISNLKWLWMIVMLIGFIAYIIQNFNNIRTQLQLVSPISIVLALVLIANRTDLHYYHDP